MRPVCPTCCPYPKTGRFPELGEEVSGCRTCPVCGDKFNQNLEIVTTHQKEEDDLDGYDNPGRYMNSLEVDREMSEENQKRWIQYFINKWPSWDRNYVIYRIAEMLDIRPGIVRAEFDKHRESFHYIKG